MAGTVTVTRNHLSKDRKVLEIKLACVADAANGSVPSTALSAAALSAALVGNYYDQGYSIEEVWTVAGTPAPDAADIAITDALGREIYTEVGIITASGAVEGSVTAHRVTSALTVAVANQATNSAKYDIYITLAK